MNRLRTRPPRHFDHRLDVEIGQRSIARQPKRVVRLLDVECPLFSRPVNGHGLDPKFTARPDDAAGDLTPVGNQNPAWQVWRRHTFPSQAGSYPTVRNQTVSGRLLSPPAMQSRAASRPRKGEAVVGLRLGVRPRPLTHITDQQSVGIREGRSAGRPSSHAQLVAATSDAFRFSTTVRPPKDSKGRVGVGMSHVSWRAA